MARRASRYKIAADMAARDVAWLRQRILEQQQVVADKTGIRFVGCNAGTAHWGPFPESDTEVVGLATPSAGEFFFNPTYYPADLRNDPLGEQFYPVPKKAK